MYGSSSSSSSATGGGCGNIGSSSSDYYKREQGYRSRDKDRRRRSRWDDESDRKRSRRRSRSRSKSRSPKRRTNKSPDLRSTNKRDHDEKASNNWSDSEEDGGGQQNQFKLSLDLDNNNFPAFVNKGTSDLGNLGYHQNQNNNLNKPDANRSAVPSKNNGLSASGIQIKLLPSITKITPNVVPKVKPKIASVFNVDDDEDEEEMPPEAKMRMKNIGRDTATSSGPNSFNKTKIGFCNVTTIKERELEEKFSTKK